MACNSSEGLGDDFLEQILAVPSAYGNGEGSGMPPMVLQLGSGSGGGGLRESLGIGMGMPLGLNLEQGFLGQDGGRVRYGDDVVEGNNVNNHHLHLNNANNNSTTSSSSSTSGITVSGLINFNVWFILFSFPIFLFMLCVLWQERESVLRTTGLFSGFRPLHVRPTVPSPPLAPPQLHHQVFF